MTASNHVITGALLITMVDNPALGIALAILSHPILDMFPHYGVDPARIMAFLSGFLADVAIAASVLLALLLVQPADYGWVIAGGIAAASPDLLSIPHLLAVLKNRPYRPGPVRRFLSWIQWSESYPGLFVEFVWFFGVGSLLLSRLT